MFKPVQPNFPMEHSNSPITKLWRVAVLLVFISVTIVPVNSAAPAAGGWDIAKIDGREYVSIESIKSFYAAFWSAFPYASVTIDNLMGEGNQVACCFAITGTHAGKYLGIPATGRGVSFTGITILRFVDGRCIERWSQADSVGLLQQLGALP